MDDFAIKVDNVSKIFKLPHEKNSSIKSVAVGFYKRKKGYELQKALDNVSFEVKKGEFFGIVGRNGSGKSTLLKLLAGIYVPTKGEVHVRGSLTPFIELGVGFNPELTGRENVYLNGALLGFSRNEMRSMYKDIVEFAELNRFMDQKLKNYSSGMQVRLAFSIAVRAKSDILLVDEVLAVGDEAFQRKCFSYFKTLKKNKRTVIFISHDMGAVRQFCDRGILLEGGEIKYIGNAQTVSDEYSKMFMSESSPEAILEHSPKHFGNGDAKIGKVSADIRGAEIIVEAAVKVNKDIKELQYGFQIWKEDGQELIGMNNAMLRLPDIKDLSAGNKLQFTWQTSNVYSNGRYFITLSLADGVGDMLDRYEEAASFTVRRLISSNTTIQPPLEVSYKIEK